MKGYFKENKPADFIVLILKKHMVLIVICVFFGLYLLSQANGRELQSNELILNESTEISAETSLDLTSFMMEDIYVDIKGAVKQPGVYQLQRGARLIDLIDEAGGFKEDAAQDSLNLALLLEDQMMVQVYSQAEWTRVNEQAQFVDKNSFEERINANNFRVDSAEKELVNINSADQSMLETLPQIGSAKAEKIIRYRQEHGSFQTIEDLMEVSGIGQKTFEGLKDLITVGY